MTPDAAGARVVRIGSAARPDADVQPLPQLEPDEVSGLTDLMGTPVLAGPGPGLAGPGPGLAGLGLTGSDHAGPGLPVLGGSGLAEADDAPDGLDDLNDLDEDAETPVEVTPGHRTAGIRRANLSPEEASMLVGAAAGGDRGAWDALVDAYGGLIWAVARNHRLSPGDAGDVSQTTWLRLVENIDRLSDPSRVGAWLATTARRECLRLLGRAKRTVLSGEELDPGTDRLRLANPEADAALLAAERDAEMRSAFGRLTPRCRELLQLLLVDPAPSYDEISAALGIPIGSIGPTRGRCLEKLRGIVEGAGINPATAGSPRR